MTYNSSIFDDVCWAREVKNAFDNGIRLIVKQAVKLLDEIPKLPDTVVPGTLISETQGLRDGLSDDLQRNDFYNYMPQMQSSRMIPVIHLQNMQASGELSPESEERTYPPDPETFRSRLLLVERAMADFLGPLSPVFSPDTEHSDIEAGAKL